VLKIVFSILLGVNAVLLAAYLSHAGTDPREPARLKDQLNADKIAFISAASAQAAASALAAPPPKAPEVFPCTEIGNFALTEARRFEERVAELELGDRQARRNVAGQDVSSYIVYLPAPGSKEGIDKKVAELKLHGVSSYFVIADNSPLRGGISLGVFKAETGAQELLASLNKQGVRGAKASPRYAASKQVAFQFRELDSATKARLDAIKADFTSQEMRSCK